MCSSHHLERVRREDYKEFPLAVPNHRAQKATYWEGASHSLLQPSFSG